MSGLIMSSAAMLERDKARTWLRLGLWLGALASAMVTVALWYPFFSLPEEQDGEAMVHAAFAIFWMSDAIILLIATATLAFFLPPVWLTLGVCSAVWLSVRLTDVLGAPLGILMSFYPPMIAARCTGLLARLRRDEPIGEQAPTPRELNAQ